MELSQYSINPIIQLTMEVNLERVIQILRTRGRSQYGGEAVTQLDHGLQCATLAAAVHSPPQLISACLLHDFGHLVSGLQEDASQLINDFHEQRGAIWLSQLFPPRVTEPIRLHVAAKRYLCTRDPGYNSQLSPVSRASLVLQGGFLDNATADDFIQQPYAIDAVQLRRWDEQSKVPMETTLDLTHFIPILQSCLFSP